MATLAEAMLTLSSPFVELRLACESDARRITSLGVAQGLRAITWNTVVSLAKPQGGGGNDPMTLGELRRYCVAYVSGSTEDRRGAARDIIARYGTDGRATADRYVGFLARVEEYKGCSTAESRRIMRLVHPCLTDELVSSLCGGAVLAIDVDAESVVEELTPPVVDHGVPHPDAPGTKAGAAFGYCNESDFRQVIRASHVVERNGNVLAVFVKNALSEGLRSRAADVLRDAATPSSARKMTNGGAVSPNSGIVGYYDYFTTAHEAKCRLTAYSRSHKDVLEDARPLIEALDGVYRQHAPRAYALQNRAIPRDVRLYGTAFSTVTVNSKFRTALHTDSGDFKNGLAVLTVLEGEYEGMFLGLQPLGIAIDVRPGDVLMFNTDLLHGNTEARSAVWSRLSVVAYLRVNLFSPGCLAVYGREKVVLPPPRTLSPPTTTDIGSGIHVPTACGAVLQAHQVDALRFAVGKVHLDSGALISLDMGMGKTLVVLAMCHVLLRENTSRRILILCPFSLLCHWRDEYEKWSRAGAVAFPFLVLEKEAEEANTIRRWDALQRGVMVCGYERFHKLTRKREEFRKAVSGLYACVLDEGHRLRSMQTFTAHDLYGIVTPRRVVLSGTPLQNNILELYVLLRWVDPTAVPPESVFLEDFHEPLLAGLRPDATPALREAAVHALYILQTRYVNPVSIRVLSTSLPPKYDNVVLLHPSAVQQRILKFLSGTRLMDVQDCGKLATHPLLLLRKASNVVFTGDEWKSYTESILEKAQSNNITMLSADSTKLALVREVVAAAVRNKERVLVFSQYMSSLDIVEISLQQEGYEVLRVDGTTPSVQRNATLAKFRGAGYCPALLLSIKALGVGINLAVASRVILLEPTFNPTTEAQAIARAHRFGQTRPVHVYRILFDDPSNDHVFQFQVRKHAVNKSVVDHDHSVATSMAALSSVVDATATQRDSALAECHRVGIIKGLVPYADVVEGFDGGVTSEEVARIEAEYARKCCARLCLSKS